MAGVVKLHALIRSVFARFRSSIRGQNFAMCAIVVLCAFVVLRPLSTELFVRESTGQMISDGSDPRALVWSYRILQRTFTEHPTRLLYGAVYTDMMGAPNGHLLWMPWSERIMVPALAPLMSDATLATCIAWLLLCFNGFATIWLGRVFRWSAWAILAAAIAFAITPYTRARVCVHMALAGVYFIPLLFAAIETVARWSPTKGSARRTLITATLAFFGVCTSAHYFLVMTLVLVPFLALFFVFRARVEQAHLLGQRVALLAAAVTLPGLFLVFQFAVPAPSEFRALTSQHPEADPALQMQYLENVGAHAIDYIAGDIKFGETDIIPAKQRINRYVLANIDRSNPHERANGVRWSMLAVAAFALGHRALRKRSPGTAPLAPSTALFCIFGLLTFALSLSPRGLTMYGDEIGPILLVNKMIGNFRVPCRFGPCVNFAVIAIASEYVSELATSSFDVRAAVGRGLGVLLTVGVIGEFIPKTPMMASVMRPIARVASTPGRCGIGVFLPFARLDYWAFEETRGTTCALLNPVAEAVANNLEEKLGKRDFSSQEDQTTLIELAQCTGLDWIVFRNEVTTAARHAICGRLGWPMLGEDACRASTVAQSTRDWTTCPTR